MSSFWYVNSSFLFYGSLSSGNFKVRNVRLVLNTVDLVTLPELIAQTNMDAQSVKKLKEEVQSLTGWMGKNSTRFITQPYQVASQDYIEAVRGM